MDFVLCSLLLIASIIIECIKYKTNAFADTIQINSSNERSTSLQSDDPVTDDDSSEDESIPSSRLSWQQRNFLITLMNRLVQNMKLQTFYGSQ